MTLLATPAPGRCPGGRWGLPLLAALLACGCFLAAAQTSGPAASQPGGGAAETGYWLRVTAGRVNLRSRADTNSVIVARAAQGMVLHGVGEQFGWHRVIPPEGTFSYAYAPYIDRLGENEGVVNVTSGSLRVRVGSSVQAVDPSQSEPQTLLPRGARVRILGQNGEWLKIAPPEGVYVYVSAEHVEPVSAEVAGRLTPARVSGDAPREGEAPEPASGPAGPAAGKKPAAEVDLSGPWGKRLEEVEAAAGAEATRPPAQQDWESVIGRFRPIAAQREDPAVARLAVAWIMQLGDRVAARDAARAAAGVLDRAAREKAQDERERERLGQLRQSGSQPTYVARGAWLRSFALGPEKDELRFKLQDPLTGKVEAYLQLDPSTALQPEQWLGKYVGVRGKRRPAAELGADIVLVEAVEVLQTVAPTSAPASSPTGSTQPAATQPARRRP